MQTLNSTPHVKNGGSLDSPVIIMDSSHPLRGKKIVMVKDLKMKLMQLRRTRLLRLLVKLLSLKVCRSQRPLIKQFKMMIQARRLNKFHYQLKIPSRPSKVKNQLR